MTRKIIVSAAAALLAGVTLAAGVVSPAAAVGNDPAKSKQEQQPQKADSRKYCIDSLMTGSRIPKRQCRTRAEWLENGVDPVDLNKQAR
jgi:hypothetical protein